MPDFQYTARNTAGELISGRLDADSKSSVMDELNRMGLHPIRVEPRAARARAVSRARAEDVQVFTRQLARLLGNGVPLARGLNLLGQHVTSTAMRDIVNAVHQDVRSGSPLHEALAAHPQVFDSVFTGMVRSGEMGGNLVTVLQRLAQSREQRTRLSAKIWNTLMYPLFMLGVGLITIVFLLAVVIPRFQLVFEDMGQLLPWPTRALIAAGDFFSAFWWLLAVAVAGAFVLLRGSLMTESGRAAMHRLALGLPVAGPLVRRAALARFARLCGVLLQNGVSILNAIDLARAGTGNSHICERLAPLRDATREGKPFAASLRRNGLFDPLSADIAAVAEETGALPAALIEIADYYDEDVLTQLQRLTAVLEPALIIALGVLVAFIVSAMLLPILQLNLGAS
jgi:type II secretory pathway component PulF